MTDTITVEETRRLIKKLGRGPLTVTQTDDLLRLCDGLDIAQEMRDTRKDEPVAECNCFSCEATAKWDNWKKGAE